MRSTCLACCLAAACGSSPPAGGPDAGTPDASGPNLVQVSAHVRMLDDLSSPAAGVPIFFSNVDGSVAWSGKSDANGKATAMVEDGGSVTTYWGVGAEPLIMSTVVGVHAGDDVDLTMENRDYGGYTGSFTASYTPYAGSASTEFFDQCDDAQVTTQNNAVTLARCAPQPLDGILLALDGSGTPIAESEINQSVADGDTVTFPAMTPVGTFHVHLDNAAVTQPLALYRYLGWRQTSKATPAGAATIDLDLPGTHAAWTQQFMDLRVGTPTATSRIVDPITPDQTSYSLDLSILPTQTLSFTYANRTVDLTTSAPFTADVLYVHFTKMVGTYPLDWYIAASPSTTSLHVPQIPADPSMQLPQDWVQDLRPTVALAHSASWNDFDKNHATVIPNLMGIVNGWGGTSRTVEIYAQ